MRADVSGKRIGIMGGSFDPVHMGHIRIADAAIEEAVDELIFMPAYVQPLKRGNYGANENDRLNMLRLATMHQKKFSVSSWEVERKTTSYTYDTIEHFKEINSSDELYFLMGSDAILNIENWHKGKELLGICKFVVGLRPTSDVEILTAHIKRLNETYGTRVVLLERKMLPVSSTMIKKLVIAREPITGLVPKPVEEYIYEHKLYG